MEVEGVDDCFLLFLIDVLQFVLLLVMIGVTYWVLCSLDSLYVSRSFMNGNSECTLNQIGNHGTSVHIQENSLLCIFLKLFSL